MAFPLDYGLYIIFGKKGCGKTCTLASLASAGLKKGMCVFTNVPLKNCFLFNPLDFGKFEFPENSLVLVDEVNLIWDNRNFKNFPQYTQNLFRYQRHYKITMYLFSQSFDTDKKIRDLADGLFLARKVWKFCWLKTVDKDFIVTKPTDYGGSDIQFGLSIRPIILSGSRHIVFLPGQYKKFDSFDKGLNLERFDDYISYVR